MKDETLYLDDIIENIDRIVKHTRGITREEFDTNETTQDVVIRRLAIIGEAAAHLSSELKERHPEVPWAEIVAMRNILVHEYEGIKLKIVWDVVVDDLPPLRLAVEAILKEIDQGS
jgi:uncharacterized protein with HEPN domain